jgi:hypothetical protein
LKIPVLVEGGQAYGSPIACDRREDAARPWNVTHQDRTIAKFDDIGKAGAYIDFMRGASIEPRIFD